MNNRRYFLIPYIVSYNFQGYPKNSFEGTVYASTENKRFVNKKEVEESIKKDFEINYPNLSIQFTNIIELSESDYNDWIAEG